MRLVCTCEEACVSILATQLKSLRKFNLRQLDYLPARLHVLPGLNVHLELLSQMAPFPVATCRLSTSLTAKHAKFAGDDIAAIGNEKSWP